MILASTLAAALAAHAQQDLPDPNRYLSYDFVEVAWIRSDVDGFGDEFTGFGANGALSLTESFYLRASATRLEVDVGGFDADTLDLAGLLGYRYGLDLGLDLVAEAGVGRAEIDISGVPGSPDSETGFLAATGLRYRANYTWEFEGTVDYTHFDGDGEFGGTVTARAHIARHAALFASYGITDDVDTLALGVRFGW